LRHEHHADAVLAGLRQRNAQRFGNFREKPVGCLDEDAGAVAGIRLATAGPAVVQVYEHLDGLFDDGVRLLPLHVDNKPHPTRFVLELRIVQSLALRQPC